MASADDNKKPTVGSSTDKPKKRINKPLIEKRRRERINECLNQLQTMITQLDKDKSKRTRSTKLEKADILEMTVDFIKKGSSNLNQGKPEDDPREENKKQYMEGYKKCVDEISTFFKTADNLSPDLKSSILGHVSKTLNKDAVSSSTKTIEQKNITSSQSSLSNCANIKPKILPASANQICLSNQVLPSTSTSGVVIQQQQPIKQTVPTTPSGNQVMVCNRELPTYVLVPTATLCQSVQLGFGTQTGQSNSLPFTLVNNSATNTGSYISTINNDVNTNCSQFVLLPSNQAVPQPPQCFMENISSSVAFGNVNQHLNVLNHPVVPNNIQPPSVDNDGNVWRPW